MPRLASLLVLGLALAVAAPTVRAQPAPAPAAQNRRERIKQRIRALRAYTLTEQLSLDPATAGRLFPLLARYDDEIDQLLQQRAAIQRRLRHVGQLRDPKAIDRLIDEAIANQHAFWSLEDQRLAALRKILTPAQTARVLVVLPAFERKVEHALLQAIRGRVGRRARHAADPVDDDDDQDVPSPPGARAPCNPFTSPHACSH